MNRVILMTRLGAEQPRSRGSFPGKVKGFFFTQERPDISSDAPDSYSKNVGEGSLSPLIKSASAQTLMLTSI